MDFLRCIRDRIRSDPEIIDELYSLIMFGSYVRGDFINGISDIDFLAVLRKDYEKVIPKLTIILEECTSGVDRILVDLPWGYLKDMDDPLNKGYPFKFLTYYQDDFLRNHIVVYGNSVADILPSYDWRELTRWKAEQLLKAVERFKDNPKMLKISAGEVAKFMAVLHGAKSIRKDDILSELEKLGDDKALEIYTAYLEGRELRYAEEYWIGFIKSRIEKYLNEI